MKAILGYQNSGKILDLSPPAEIAFMFIKQQLDRSDEAYAEKCERNRKTIQDYWNKVKSDTNEYERIQSNTNVNDGYLPNPNPNPNPEKKEKKDNRHKYGDKVKMTEEQYQSHIEQHGKDAVDKKIDDMNDYCVMNGKSYTDYNRALQNWFRKDDEQAKAKIEAEIEQWVNPK